MKLVALIIASLVATGAYAEIRRDADVGNESKSGTDKSVSEDTNISTWGTQALWMSDHPVVRRCMVLTRNQFANEPAGRMSKEPPDIYPLALESSVCSHLIALGTKYASFQFVGPKVVPQPNSPEAKSAVSKIPFDSLVAQARSIGSFQDRQLVDQPDMSWRVLGTPYTYDTKKGYVSILMGANPWFDDQHIEGRVLTFKQARSNSTANSIATKIKAEIGVSK